MSEDKKKLFKANCPECAFHWIPPEKRDNPHYWDHRCLDNDCVETRSPVTGEVAWFNPFTGHLEHERFGACAYFNHRGECHRFMKKEDWYDGEGKTAAEALELE